VSDRGSSLRQLEARHASMSWRALVSTARAMTGLIVLAPLRGGLGVDTSPPEGCCREPEVFLCQLLSSQWVTAARFSWSIQSFPAATRLFAEGYGRRPVDVARREEGARMRVKRTKCLSTTLTAAEYSGPLTEMI